MSTNNRVPSAKDRPGDIRSLAPRGWTNPLLAVLAATLAIIANTWVVYSHERADQAFEEAWQRALSKIEAVEASAVQTAPGAAAACALLQAQRPDADRGTLSKTALLSASVRLPEWTVPRAGLVPVQFRVADSQSEGSVAPANSAAMKAYADPDLGSGADSKVPALFGRFTSGLKVGDAVVDEGATGGSGTWLADVGLGGTGASWDYTARARVTSLSTNSLIAGTFAARKVGQARGKPIGLVAAAVAENPNTEGAWSIYAETMVGPNSPGGAAGVEFNTVNSSGQGPAGDLVPYGSGTRGMTVLNLAVGGDRHVHGRTEPISAFASLRGNGSTAKAGLVFKENALERIGDPKTCYARAVTLPQAYGQSWYGGTDGAEVFRLYSTISDADHAQALSFSDDGVRIVRGLGEATAVHVPFVSDSVSYLQLRAVEAGRPVTIAAGGPDPVDLMLESKGGGAIDIHAEVEEGSVEPTHRVVVKFNGIQYYLALDPA